MTFTAGVSPAELFVPELVLGVDALEPGDRERLGAYLTEVLRARDFPLHTAVAWNALHFGYDPSSASYPPELLDGFMPFIALGGTRNEAVPVGALAWVTVGGAEGSVWAEVVGKDGRPPGGDGYEADPALAGADAPSEWVDGFEQAVVSEALIVDFSAFGPIPALESRLERLQRRGRLDRHGLILTDSVYRPVEAAADEDLWFYARWLVDNQPDLLRAGPLGAVVGADAGRDVLASALLGSLAAVSDILATTVGLRRWGDYTIDESWVADVDLDANLPLGAGDLEHLLSGLRRDGERAPAAATLLPRLEPLAVSGPQPDRPDRELADPFAGVGYLRQVLRADRWLADRVDEEGRALAGRDGQLVSVRVDDFFPYGGLWRAEPVCAGHPLLEVPADVPLRLGRDGWAALAGYLGISVAECEALIAEAKAAAQAAAAHGDEPDADDRTAEAEEEAGDGAQPTPTPLADLDATIVSATLTLRAGDLDRGGATLGEHFSWLDGAVTLMLSHSGDLDDDQACQQVTTQGSKLVGVSWPMDFFAGIRLHLSVFAGGSTLFAATLPLVPPIEVDGIEYHFAFDPSVVGASGGGGEVDLVAVLLAGLGRHGRPASDGTRRAGARELATICFGPARPESAVVLVETTLEPAVESGRLAMIGSEYAWAPRHSLRPARAATPSGWGAPTRLERTALTLHHVPGFIRRLPPGFVASADKQASYRAARAAGEILYGPEQLPDGCTWVRGHDRGGRAGAYAAALAGVVSTISGVSPEPDELAALSRAWNLNVEAEHV